MVLLTRFVAEVKKKHLFQKNDLLIVAVSGGADSVALCELCKDAAFNFEIAHCNFQLRGAESERDEAFVKELASEYGVKFHLKKFDTERYADANGLSIQLAARQLRYEWFQKLISESAANCYLLTAHHANDNIETLLMNFFKGTGMQGLQGIPEKTGYLRRPLLFAAKADILEFLKSKNKSFVEDSSNQSDKYTRNYFRNQLIPSIQKVFPQVEENLKNNLERFLEIQMLYDQSITAYKKQLITHNENEIAIPVLKLLKARPLKTILYEILKDYDFSAPQTNEVIKLLVSGSGKFVSSQSHRAFINRNWLVIAPLQTAEAKHILVEKMDTIIAYNHHQLVFEFKEWLQGTVIPNDPQKALIDVSLIEYPLLLRKWRQGDYFYPLGMKKKKKLSRFFIDQKLSLTQKENIWILESNKKIMWVIGQRIDDRFKVTDKTRQILEIKNQ